MIFLQCSVMEDSGKVGGGRGNAFLRSQGGGRGRGMTVRDRSARRELRRAAQESLTHLHDMLDAATSASTAMEACGGSSAASLFLTDITAGSGSVGGGAGSFSSMAAHTPLGGRMAEAGEDAHRAKRLVIRMHTSLHHALSI